MIRSMTGFGRGQVSFQDGKITAEIKTVNHKFFDVSLRIPESMMQLEERVKELVQRDIGRGKVTLNITFDGLMAKDERISINEKLAKHYVSELSRLRRHLGLQGEVSVKDLIALPGVLNYSVSGKAMGTLWPKLKEALDLAVKRLAQDREKEGRAIFLDLDKRARIIDRMVTIIRSRTGINVEEYRKKFSDKIKALASGREIDLGRLEMEVAIYAKNCDISEEITRLKSHLDNFRKTISGKGEVGKKLDFIAQELHREINTVGSKSGDFPISKNVIEVKSEIEKIREQVKNLE